MARLVLTDVSPLIAPARIDALDQLRGLFGSARDAFARLHGADLRISAQVIATVLSRVGE